MEISDWHILPGDSAFASALKKERKRRANEDLTIIDYQLGNLKSALNLVQKFRTAIDAGANYGLMSFHLNQKFQKIHAFEVEPAVRDCLKKNVEKFNLDKVIIHDFGLSDKDETVSLHYNKNSFCTYINREQGGSLPCKSIDSLKFVDVDFLKIDCEGYEPFILKGAEQTIKQYRPVILMEEKNLSNRYYNIEGNLAVEILHSWGYKIAVNLTKDCVMTYSG